MKSALTVGLQLVFYNSVFPLRDPFGMLRFSGKIPACDITDIRCLLAIHGICCAAAVLPGPAEVNQEMSWKLGRESSSHVVLGIGERPLFDSVHVFVFGNPMWNVFSKQMCLLVVLTDFFFPDISDGVEWQTITVKPCPLEISLIEKMERNDMWPC